MRAATRTLVAGLVAMGCGPSRTVVSARTPRAAGPPPSKDSSSPATTSGGEGEANRACHSEPQCTAMCDRGDLAACAELGAMYLEGRGVAGVDYARGLPLVDRACRGGNARACITHGSHYKFGPVATRDEARAQALFERSAHLYWTECEVRRHALGCAGLGVQYLMGLGLPSSRRHAALYLRMACEAGATAACQTAAGLLLTEGDPTSTAQALRALSRECDRGEREACELIGLLYREGLGVPADHGRALAHLQRACDLGLRRACDCARSLREAPTNR